MVANHVLLLAALSGIVAGTPFPMLQLRARSYNTSLLQSTAIIPIAYIQYSLLSSSLGTLPTQSSPAASATSPLVVAASGPPDLTAIVPLRPYTFLSTEAAITFQNTAGLPVITERPTTLATTTFIPYSSLATTTDTSPIEVRLSSVFGSDTSTAMLEAYSSTSSTDISSTPMITDIVATSTSFAFSSSLSSMPADIKSSSSLPADSPSFSSLPAGSTSLSSIPSLTTPFSTMPSEAIISSSMPVDSMSSSVMLSQITSFTPMPVATTSLSPLPVDGTSSSSMPVDITTTFSMLGDITSSLSMPVDSASSLSMPSSTSSFSTIVSTTTSSTTISSVTALFSTLPIFDSSTGFSATPSTMPRSTTSFDTIISSTSTATIVLTVTSSSSTISAVVDSSTSFPISSAPSSPGGLFGSSLDTSSAARSKDQFISSPFGSTGRSSDSTYTTTDIASVQPSMPFSGIYSTSTPLTSNSFGFNYYSRNFSLSLATSVLSLSTQPVTTLSTTSTTQTSFPIYTASSLLSSTFQVSTTNTVQPIESSVSPTILASYLPTYRTVPLSYATTEQSVPAGYFLSSFTLDSSASTSSVALITTSTIIVEITSTTTTTLPAMAPQPSTTDFRIETSISGTQAGATLSISVNSTNAASTSSALSGLSSGIISTYPPVAYSLLPTMPSLLIQATSSATSTPPTFHLVQPTSIQSLPTSSPSLVPTSATYTAFVATSLSSSTFISLASSTVAQISQFAFSLPFTQTTVSYETLQPPFSVYLLPSETSQSVVPSSTTSNAAGITIVPINPNGVFTITMTEKITEHVTDTVTQIVTTTVAG